MFIRVLSFTFGMLFATELHSQALLKEPQSPMPMAESAESPKAKVTPTLKPAKVTSLGAITTDVESDLTIVTARLNKAPDWKTIELEEHGTFLQIKLPQTQIPSSGEFFDGNGPYLRKLASFQLPNEDGALRLFINQDASKAKSATTAELLGDRLVITIDHKKLEQLISPASAKIEAASTASNNAANSAAAIDVALPQNVVTGTKTTASSVNPNTVANNKTLNASNGDQLHAQLTKGAGICAILFLTLMGLQLHRVRRRKSKKSALERDYMEPATMRVLSSIAVGQKQKLTLVQVGGQQLLIGVGPESINLITAIEPRPKVTNFANALESANPNAEIRLKAPEQVTPTRPTRKPISASTLPSHPTASIKGNSINVGIGEDGPINMKGQNGNKEADITKILRDRLRNLPPG
jgi:flagellar biogenesis protein FliO